MSIFGPTLRHVAIDARDHTIAVHCGAGVFGGDKNVRLARFFWNEKTETGLMDRQLSSNKVGFGRKDGTILPDARDLAGVLEFAQSFSHFDAVATFCAERVCDLVSISRPIIRRP